MSGGKGGSNTSTTQIPDWVKEPAERNLARAEEVQKIGYTPWYGPDVAGFTPAQEQAFQAQTDAAAAFGLVPQGTQAMSGMPQAQQFGSGIQGYSSAPLYEQALAEMKAKQPTFAQRYEDLYS